MSRLESKDGGARGRRACSNVPVSSADQDSWRTRGGGADQEPSADQVSATGGGGPPRSMGGSINGGGGGASSKEFTCGMRSSGALSSAARARGRVGRARFERFAVVRQLGYFSAVIRASLRTQRRLALGLLGGHVQVSGGLPCAWSETRTARSDGASVAPASLSVQA